MRFLYDKHKADLPRGAVNPKNVSSNEDESDTEPRTVKFI